MYMDQRNLDGVFSIGSDFGEEKMFHFVLCDCDRIIICPPPPPAYIFCLK